MLLYWCFTYIRGLIIYFQHAELGPIITSLNFIRAIPCGGVHWPPTFSDFTIQRTIPLVDFHIYTCMCMCSHKYMYAGWYSATVCLYNILCSITKLSVFTVTHRHTHAGLICGIKRSPCIYSWASGIGFLKLNLKLLIHGSSLACPVFLLHFILYPVQT